MGGYSSLNLSFIQVLYRSTHGELATRAGVGFPKGEERCGWFIKHKTTMHLVWIHKVVGNFQYKANSQNNTEGSTVTS